MGFIPAFKDKEVLLIDGGDRLFSTTTLATVGRAVVGVLQHPEQTKDRAVYVQDTATTLKQLAAIGKRVLGPDNWDETVVSTDEILKQAWDKLKDPKVDPDFIEYHFLRVSTWAEGHGGYFQDLDNELLGITELSDNELESLVDCIPT